MSRKPDFLIVGAPRCGTTTLFRYLAEHPDVFMPRVKEVRFFDQNYERGYAWYEEHFLGWDGEQAVGEASPGYMSDAVAMQRLAHHLPDAKLLVSMRNPVDRAYSDYWMMSSLGVETRPFVEAVEQELDEARRSGSSETSRRYLDRGGYLRQLERMTELYPRSAVKTIVFEEFVDQSQATIEEVFAFLGVEPTFRPSLLGQAVNQHVNFRSKTLRRWTKNAPRLLRRVVGRLNSRTEAYEPLSPDLRRRLLAHFAAHNQDLELWLGRDLDHWKA